MLGSTVHSYVTKIFVIVPFCSYKPMQAEAAASLNDCKKKVPDIYLIAICECDCTCTSIRHNVDGLS